MKRHYIIPIFVPHQGCPHDCVFCNQRSITGCQKIMETQEVSRLIEKYLTFIPADEGIQREIAFYGGSFTGIRREEQQRLLEVARQYKQRGMVSGIRISTRPDYITMESLQFLTEYGVSVIEIGVQSLDDDVLLKSNRGHVSKDVISAVKMIRMFNFSLGLQTMIGLPGDTPVKAMATARSVVRLRPDFVRIYPTVVIEGTMLASLYRQRLYVPLSLSAAVDLAAAALVIYDEAAIPVIRIGLQPTEDLCGEHGIIAGPFHPAFRELVESRLAYAMLCYLLNQLPHHPSAVTFRVNSRYLSVVTGNKKENVKKLSLLYKLQQLDICQDNSLEMGKIALSKADTDVLNLQVSKVRCAKLPGIFRDLLE